MQRRHPERNWKSVLLLLVLFVLSILAPRIWEGLRRRGEPSAAGHRSWTVPLSPLVPPPAPVGEGWRSAVRYSPLTSDLHARVGRKAPADAQGDPFEAPGDQGPSFEGGDPFRVVWAQPRMLLKQLADLQMDGRTRAWAQHGRELVLRLTGNQPPSRPEAIDILRQLRAHLAAADIVEQRMGSDDWSGELRRVRRALQRRVEVWEGVQSLEDTRLARLDTRRPSPRELASCVAEVAHAMAGPNGDGWRDYLLLDALEAATDQPLCGDDELALAREILRRLDPEKLTPLQRQFLQSGPLAELNTELARLGGEHVETATLLARIEQYEWTGRPSQARRIAADVRRLKLAPGPHERELHDHLESHYRNINVRLALSDELLSRLLARSDASLRSLYGTLWPGSDRAAAARPDLKVRVLPAAAAGTTSVRLHVEAVGQASICTCQRQGLATVLEGSRATYTARKVLELRPEGVRVYPAQAEVEAISSWRNVESDLDGIPLVGALVRAAADTSAGGSGGISRRVAADAEQALDVTIDPAAARLNEQFVRRLLVPLRDMAIDPEAIVTPSGEHRLAIRLRLASANQLAAHTPRPRARADSLASLQVHQSALNNVLERLELGGKTFTPRELQAYLQARLNLPPSAAPRPWPAHLVLKFSPIDPCLVQFDSGRVRLVVSLAELRHQSVGWADLTIQADYAPRHGAGGLEFVRHGGVQVLGRELSLASQAVLQTLAAGCLPVAVVSPLPLPAHNPAQPETSQLTQLELRDGWLALALGPQSPASTTAARGMSRRDSSPGDNGPKLQR
jgi:hypothetical protein